MPDKIEISKEPQLPQPRNYTATLSSEQVEVLRSLFDIPLDENGVLTGFTGTAQGNEMRFLATFTTP